MTYLCNDMILKDQYFIRQLLAYLPSKTDLLNLSYLCKKTSEIVQEELKARYKKLYIHSPEDLTKYLTERPSKLGTRHKINFTGAEWYESNLGDVTSKCHALREANFKGNMVISADSLRHFFGQVKWLKRVNLNECREVNQDVLDVLANESPDLEELRLSSCLRIKEPSLLHIAQKFKKLKRLSLNNCAVDAEVLIHLIRELPELKQLTLKKFPYLDQITLLRMAQVIHERQQQNLENLSSDNYFTIKLSVMPCLTRDEIYAVFYQFPHINYLLNHF